MATPIRNGMTDHSVKDGTGDPILGSEVDVNPNLLADILDGTQATDLGGAGTVDFLALRVLDLDNAAGSVQTNLTLEWDPGDGGNLTDNSSGIGIDFIMPDDADNQIVFGSLDVMCVSDANGSERGGFSFRAQSGGGSESEIATLETGLTTTGTVLTLATAEPTVVDGDVLGRIDFQAPSEGSGTDAILVAASIYAEADDTFAADNNDADLVFAVAESEAAAERMRLSYDGTNVGLTFSGATTVTTGSGAMTLTSPAAATWSTAAGALTVSGNAGVNIQEDGTDVIAIDTSRAVALTLGSDATGDIIYRNASGKLARLAVGSDGEVLKLASGLPSWAADTSGAVSSVGNGADNRVTTFSGSDTLNGEANLTFDGSTLSVSGSIDMVANTNRIDLDADNDTSIRASADDTIMFELAGADDFSMTANSLNVLSGSVIDLADNAPVQFGDADDASIKFDATNTVLATAGSFVLQTNGTTEHMRVDTGGTLYINDDENGKMTQGITINQGANDNNAIDLKSSDVNHGRTGHAETDTWFSLAKYDGNKGGCLQYVMMDNEAQTPCFDLRVTGGQATTTATQDGCMPLMTIRVAQHDGSNSATAMTAGGFAFGVRCTDNSNNDHAVFAVDEDGDLYAGNTNDSIALSDDKNDPALLRGFDHAIDEMGLASGMIKNRWDDFVKTRDQDLVELGVLGDTVENGGLYCVTQHTRLMNSAIWQVYSMLLDVIDSLPRETQDKIRKVVPNQLLLEVA